MRLPMSTCGVLPADEALDKNSRLNPQASSRLAGLKETEEQGKNSEVLGCRPLQCNRRGAAEDTKSDTLERSYKHVHTIAKLLLFAGASTRGEEIAHSFL